jgi:hypothetical protein
MTRPQDMTVRTDTELLALWQRLMGSGGFGRRSLWMVFLDGDDRPQPVVAPIDDIPEQPDRRLLDALASVIEGLKADGGVAAVVLLLSRPGPQDMTSADRDWARALAPLSPGRPIHLATADRVQVFAPDDLLAA